MKIYEESNNKSRAMTPSKFPSIFVYIKDHLPLALLIISSPLLLEEDMTKIKCLIKFSEGTCNDYVFNSE